ncbi:hypothetical protein JCM8202_005667 [Rhodotorula sphaerocarpa]
MAARSTDLFKKGLLRLAIGTTISQAKNPKHMQVYRAVMDKVKEWAEFGCMHSKEALMTTPSFLEAMTEKHQVPLTSHDEEEEVAKYRSQLKERHEQILARNGPTSRAVEKLNKARATMVSMSSSGLNIKQTLGLANQPHRSEAMQASRWRINKKKVGREENHVMADQIGESEWKKKREQDRKSNYIRTLRHMSNKGDIMEDFGNDELNNSEPVNKREGPEVASSDSKEEEEEDSDRIADEEDQYVPPSKRDNKGKAKECD